MGRPSEYNPAIASLICEAIACGESMRTVCEDHELPRVSVYRWLAAIPEFRDQYARAKELGLDRMADELLEIADYRSEDVQRSKLRVDTRKWIMSKLAPKKYGDRQVIAGDADQPLMAVIRRSTDPK